MPSGQTRCVRPNGVSAAAIIASIMFAGIWGASCVLLMYYSDGDTWSVNANGGALSVCWGEPPGWPYKIAYGIGFHWEADLDEAPLVLPESLTIDKYRCVSVPLWPLLLVAAYLAVREVRRVRSERRRIGHCRQCGYDLRGLPEPRCPECGARFDVEPQQRRR